MAEFMSHAAMVGAFIVGVVLVIWQITQIFLMAVNTPDDSGDGE